jgi:hypothetical protein
MKECSLMRKRKEKIFIEEEIKEGMFPDEKQKRRSVH